MKRIIRYTPVLGILVALIVSLGCDKKAANQGNNGVARIEVEVDVAKLGPVQTTISATGTIKATQQANVGAKVSGRVEKVEIDEGEKVDQGDPIVVLQQVDFTLAVKDAEASVNNSKASVRVAEVSLEKARDDFDRYVKLHTEKAVSDQMFEEVRTAKRLAEENLELARTGLARAKTQLELTEQRLSDSVIRAPFDGIVVAKAVNEGEFVSQASPPLVRIMDLSKVKIDVGIPEEHSQKIQVGQTASLKVDAYPNANFEGKVITVNPHVDERSRAFNVQVEVPNDYPDHFLKAGMFARVTIFTGQRDNVVLVPKSALLTLDGKRVLFIVKDLIAARREVEVGFEDDESAEIVSGVSAGESIVVKGNWGLSDGQQVVVTRG